MADPPRWKEPEKDGGRRAGNPYAYYKRFPIPSSL